jgi:hypothetical protein
MKNKKNIIFSIVILIVLAGVSVIILPGILNNKSHSTEGMIFSDSDKKLMISSDLNNLDAFTLKLAQNEILARGGYKFVDEDLNNYFSNTSWYKPKANATKTPDNLNSIEKQNYILLGKKYTQLSNSCVQDKETVQTFEKDINNDAQKEIIKVVFNNNLAESSCKYTVTVTSGGKDYTISDETDNPLSNIYFADFNVKDNLYEFYFEQDGASDDPVTNIFMFDKVLKKDTIDGFITSYDGAGRVLTEFSRTNDKNRLLLSYYQVGQGIILQPKNLLIGKYLQYDSKLILFNTVQDDSDKEASFMSLAGSELSDDQLIQFIDRNYTKDQIAGIAKENEKLKVVDVDYDSYDRLSDPFMRNVPIKVQKEDGKKGWLVWMNLGD